MVFMVGGSGVIDRSAYDPDDVLALLREASSLYAELNSCAERQRSLIVGEDMGPLLVLLAERQKLSAKLIQISNDLTPIRRDWENCRKTFSASALREADHLVSAITQNLRRAIDTDEEDARLLRARKQTVARALNTSHSTERAMVAYRTERVRVSRIDQLDETP